jgi:hypothetical protein
MAELTDALNEMLAGRTGHMGRRIGAGEDRTRVAVESAVPASLAARSGEGGGILDSVGGLPGGDRSR